jgi:hypothetical protein
MKHLVIRHGRGGFRRGDDEKLTGSAPFFMYTTKPSRTSQGFPTVLSGQSEKPQQLCERTLRRKLPVGKNKIARNDQLDLSARACGVETQH